MPKITRSHYFLSFDTEKTNNKEKREKTRNMLSEIENILIKYHNQDAIKKYYYEWNFDEIVTYEYKDE